MPDYYNAPGAAASDAMQAFMMQQQQLKHQQLLDSLAVQRGQLDQQREGRLATSDNLELEIRRMMLEEKKQETAERIKDKAKQAHIAELGTMVPGDIPSSKMLADAKEFGTEHLVKDPKQGLRDFAKTLPADSPEAAGVQQQLGGPVRVFAGLPAQRQALDAKTQQEQYIASLPAGPLKDAAMFRLRTGSAEPAGVIKAENPPPPKPEAVPMMRQSSRGDGPPERMVDGKWVPWTADVPANAHWLTTTPPADHSAADATRAATESNKVQVAREHGYTEHSKASTKVSDQITALDHLDEVLGSNTAAADGLIVPMLLKGTIAGGGVRITQSEIDQVLKARNVYDSMQLSLNKWLNTSADKNGVRPPIVLTTEQKAAIADLSKRLRAKAETAYAKMVTARKAIDSAKTIDEVNHARSAFEENRYGEPDAVGVTPAKPTAADLIKKYGGQH